MRVRLLEGEVVEATLIERASNGEFKVRRNDTEELLTVTQDDIVPPSAPSAASPSTPPPKQIFDVGGKSYAYDPRPSSIWDTPAKKKGDHTTAVLIAAAAILLITVLN